MTMLAPSIQPNSRSPSLKASRKTPRSAFDPCERYATCGAVRLRFCARDTGMTESPLAPIASTILRRLIICFPAEGKNRGRDHALSERSIRAAPDSLRWRLASRGLCHCDSATNTEANSARQHDSGAACGSMTPSDVWIESGLPAIWPSSALSPSFFVLGTSHLVPGAMGSGELDRDRPLPANSGLTSR